MQKSSIDSDQHLKFVQKVSLLKLLPILRKEVSPTRPASDRNMEYSLRINVNDVVKKLKRDEKETIKKDQPLVSNKLIQQHFEVRKAQKRGNG